MKRMILVTMLLLSAAHAWGDTSTRYTYREKGFSGYMDVFLVGRFFKITIETMDKANGQQCSFTARESGPRTKNEYPAEATTETGAMFKLDFSKDGKIATVEVVDKGEECGMTGWFGGKYTRTKVK